MDPADFRSGDQTPTRGSSAASIERRKRAEAQNNNHIYSDDKDSSIAKKLIETLQENESDDDDDSFVTMEEIKDTASEQLTAEESTNDGPSKNGREQFAPTVLTTVSKAESFQRLSHHFSREILRRRSSITEALPETPAGWTILLSGLASACLGYELHLQESLSCPPLVFGQCGDSKSAASAAQSVATQMQQHLPLQAIYERLSATPTSILSQSIKPSLFVGTRGSISSTVAYAMHGPPKTDANLTFRQVLTMSADGAEIGLDYELPAPSSTDKTGAKERKQKVLSIGGIHQPLVLVLTGMNNDTSFGYVRALMRTFTDRGWMAVSMNFRGCGKVPLTTPRCYNGGYTGDLRNVVQYLESRLAKDVPLFLIGNSLSANIVTKYLGEEGLAGTLPKCVSGGVCLGNPLLMHVSNLHAPWKEILALGVKKDVLLNWPYLRHMTVVPSFWDSIKNVLKARDIGEIDAALAPIFIRNESYAPFAVKVGFDNEEHYWSDSSSFKYIKHISVPCLQIVASDDAICYKSFQKKLAQCILNPYVLCLETKCGGHLGWQESNPDSNAPGIGVRWADRACADFLEAIQQTGATSRPAIPMASNNAGHSNKSDDTSGMPAEGFANSLDPVHFRSKL